MRKHVAEFVGTFFLVLAVCLAVTAKIEMFAAIAIGLTLMAMVYATGHISGGMLNPAVTLGVMLRGKLGPVEAIGFMVTQVVAACAAASVAFLMINAIGEAVPAPFVIKNVGAALGAEFMGAFALVFVVLNVATARGTEGNPYFGVAIGLTVAGMAMTLSRFSGAAFNPAVAVGAAVFGLLRASDIWIHIAADLAGGIVAALAFRFTHQGE